MTLHDLSNTARRGWWLVIVLAALGALVGAWYGGSRPVTYTSTAQSYVVVNNSGTSGGDAFNAGQAAQARIASYAALGSSAKVGAGVVAALQLPMSAQDAASHLTVTFPPGTLLLQISATADTARLAQDLAAEGARQLAAEVARLEEPAPRVPAWARLVPISDATPAVASPDRTSTFVALGGVAGAVLGAVAAWCWVAARPRARTSGEIAAVLDGPTVPNTPQDLRAAVVRAGAGADRPVAVAGIDAEPWSASSALADSLAATGASVLLVDLRPEVAPAEGGAARAAEQADGLTALLAPSGTAERAPRAVPGEVALVGPGAARAGLPDLLLAPGASERLERLGEGFDYTVFVGAESGSGIRVGAPVRLAVVGLGKRSAPQYRAAIDEIAGAGDPVVVTTTAPASRLPVLAGRRDG